MSSIIDFPHLVLALPGRTGEYRKGDYDRKVEKQLTQAPTATGRLRRPMCRPSGELGQRRKEWLRPAPVIEKRSPVFTGKPHLPQVRTARPLHLRSQGSEAVAVNRTSPLRLSAARPCSMPPAFVNYNNPRDWRWRPGAVLVKNGVETADRLSLLLRHAAVGAWCNLDKVAEVGKAMSPRSFRPWIEKGLRRGRPDTLLCLDVEVRVAAYCCPMNEECEAVSSEATFDITEYVDRHCPPGRARPGNGLKPLGGGVAAPHGLPCQGPEHGRRRRPRCCACMPEADVKVIERCSGHGGSWGVMKAELRGRPSRWGARQPGKPRQQPLTAAGKVNGTAFIASECPLAGVQICCKASSA